MDNLAGVKRIVDHRQLRLDLYHHLLTLSGPGVLAVLVAAFFVFNLIFAGLYLLRDGSIASAQPGSYADAFFFSVQTMATVGYGQMYPATLYANILVTIEVLFGMSSLAVATGLIFARFSRPTARVMFSRVAIVQPQSDVPTLMFRAANQRRNRILEAQVTVMVLRNEVTAEGDTMRRFYDLKVSRSRTPMFALSWTIIHPIDRDSPLFGETAETLAAKEAEIVISIIGLDETFSQTVYARHAYLSTEIQWNRRFVDILGRTPQGRPIVDYRRFHETSALIDAAPRKGER